MKNLNVTCTAESGLSDIILDLILFSVYGKIYGYDKVFFQWRPFRNRGGYFQQNKRLIGFDANRVTDRSFESISKYLSLPDNIILYNNKNSLYDVEYNFCRPAKHYSPHSFFMEHIQTPFSFEEFKQIYMEVCSQMFVKNLDCNLTPDLTVHLRRKDKIVDTPDCCQISFEEKELLEKKTKKSIDNFISKNNNIKIYFASDCKTTKKQYEELYKDNVLKLETENIHEVQNTYLDLKIMSNSEEILMSCKYTGFSILAAMMGSKKLYYFYTSDEDNCFENLNYQIFDNIIKL